MSAPGCLQQTQDLFHSSMLFPSIECPYLHSCYQVVLSSHVLFSHLLLPMQSVSHNVRKQRDRTTVPSIKYVKKGTEQGHMEGKKHGSETHLPCVLGGYHSTWKNTLTTIVLKTILQHTHIIHIVL